MKHLSLFIILLLSFVVANAQEVFIHSPVEIKESKKETNETLEERPIAFSVYHRLTTNGDNYKQIANNFSYNMFYGYNGALNGVEIGALGNIQKFYTKGIQLAGLMNVTGTDQSGIQISGLTNKVGRNTSGVQISGLSNISGAKSRGVHLAGIVNVTGEESRGINMGGLGNVIGGNATGTTIAGTLNRVKGNAKGLNVAGLANITGDTKGVQIAGIINIAKKASGLLIAPVNSVDSLGKCLPIGLVTIVKQNRLSQLELSVSEQLYGQLAFRFGARKWYNIYSLAYQLDETERWGFGFGFGSQWYLNSDNSLFTNIEATTMHINEGYDWIDELNLNSRLRVAIGKQFGRWQAFAAADLNVLVSNYYDGENKTRTASDYDVYSYKPKTGAHVQIWPGGSVGVRYVFNR